MTHNKVIKFHLVLSTGTDTVTFHPVLQNSSFAPIFYSFPKVHVLTSVFILNCNTRGKSFPGTGDSLDLYKLRERKILLFLMKCNISSVFISLELSNCNLRPTCLFKSLLGYCWLKYHWSHTHMYIHTYASIASWYYPLLARDQDQPECKLTLSMLFQYPVCCATLSHLKSMAQKAAIRSRAGMPQGVCCENPTLVNETLLVHCFSLQQECYWCQKNVAMLLSGTQQSSMARVRADNLMETGKHFTELKSYWQIPKSRGSNREDIFAQ